MSIFTKIGHVVASAVGAVASGVESIVNTGADAVEKVIKVVVTILKKGADAVDTWVHEHGGPILGAVTSLVVGGFKGMLDGFRAITHAFVQLTKAAADFVGSVLNLDPSEALRALGEVLADIAGLFIDGVRTITGGFLVGAIAKQYQQQSLREFVKNLINSEFNTDPAVRDRILMTLRITSGDWGLHLLGYHYVSFLDSEHTPLWQWHQEGFLDLYAMAGVLSFDSIALQRPRTWVRVVGSDGRDNFLPVNRSIIADYLQNQGRGQHLRVYAMNRQAVEERLDVAVEKLAKLRIHLEWNQETSVFGIPFPCVEITSKKDFAVDIDLDQITFAVRHGLRTGARLDECNPVAFAAFALLPAGRFGNTVGRSIVEGAKFTSCTTKGREDDRCCNVVAFKKGMEGSCVVHKDYWPAYAFRYVLAHELGHYFGLCHFGHDGFQNIMYTLAADANLNMFDIGLVNYYMQNEPEFTFADSKNSWRFIVDQMRCCLDPALECGAPVGMITQSDTARIAQSA